MKFRYIAAQILVLMLWAVDWSVGGNSNAAFGGYAVLGALLIYATFLIPLAVVVGLVDGFAGKGREGRCRQIILTIFVVALAAYISYAGLSLMVFEDLYGQLRDPPSVGNRLTALVGMEAALLLEFGIAILIRRLL